MRKHDWRPTQKDVQELFDYNPESGELIKRVVNGCKDPLEFRAKPEDYLKVSVYGKSYPTHHIIWLHQKGYLPKQIDHKNRCRWDNRLNNLREVTTAQNSRNRTTQKTPHKILGIFSYETKKKGVRWGARISDTYKQYTIGIFDSFTEAVCHRLAAEQCLDPESYGLNSPAYLYVTQFIQKRIPEQNISFISNPYKKKRKSRKKQLTFAQYQQKMANTLNKPKLSKEQIDFLISNQEQESLQK